MPQNSAVADLSVAISSAPDGWTFDQMMRVNKELMDHYGTRYVVDVDFPPHLSLLLSGVASSALPDLEQLVREKAKALKTISTVGTQINLDASGFLRMKCEATPELLAAHNALVEGFRVIHEKDPRSRRQDFGRWTELTFENGKMHDAFQPHLTLGWVDPDNGFGARALVESILSLPFPIELQTLDLAEVDQSKQRWRIVVSEKLNKQEVAV